MAGLALVAATFVIFALATGSPAIGAGVALAVAGLAALVVLQFRAQRRILARLTTGLDRVRSAAQEARQAARQAGRESRKAIAEAAKASKQRDADLRSRLNALEKAVGRLESSKRPADLSRASLDRIAQDTTRSNGQLLDSIDAMLQLSRLFAPAEPVPLARTFGGTPDFLFELVRAVQDCRPRLIVEAGSGLSSIWLGLAVTRWCPGARVVSLEHHDDYLAQTRREVVSQSLQQVVEIRRAPLTSQNSTGQLWYDQAAWSDLSQIDLLIVDGPPGSTGPLARYPALPLLRSRLSSPAVIILDDTSRPAEQDVIARWREEFGIEATDLGGPRGVTRLQVS